MSNALDKNHPFRTAVDYVSTSASEPHSEKKTVASEFAQNDSDKQSLMTIFFTWFKRLKPKTRAITIAVLGGLICFGYTILYDAVFGPAPKKLTNSIQFSASSQDDDVISQGQPGWISRTFCRGVRRSFICD